jgi:hypothetical protein
MIGYPISYGTRGDRSQADRLDRPMHDGGPLSSVDHELWARLLTGELNPNIRTLATRLIVTRLRIDVANNPAVLPRAVQELRRFFADNKFAHRDLNAITDSER